VNEVGTEKIVSVEVKLLGSMEAVVGGVSFAPTAGKPRQLLAILALNAGKVVPVSAIMDEIWGPATPRSALTTLHTYVGKLRKDLDCAIGDESRCAAKTVVATEQLGYRLNVPPENVDAGRYVQSSALGRRIAETGDPETASATLASALDLWRGSALSDVSAGSQLMIEVARLEENRLADLDLRIEMDLALGRHRGLLGELAALCARYPMSENFHAHYMLALYRSGWQWRALEIFQRLRNTMVNQLGVDPSAKVRQLQQAILRGDPSMDGPEIVSGGRAAAMFAR
jgi:DNA-binding SARP family transcriptional activator